MSRRDVIGAGCCERMKTNGNKTNHEYGKVEAIQQNMKHYQHFQCEQSLIEANFPLYIHVLYCKQ